MANFIPCLGIWSKKATVEFLSFSELRFIDQVGGLDQPIPAGIFISPAVAIIQTQAVNTKGPVSAGSPHVPKNLCNAGITTTEQVTVANTAMKNVAGVNGRNEVSAIITRT